MKRHTLRNTLSTGTLAVSLAIFAMTGTAYAQNAAQAGTEASDSLTGDIVVTARKREESLLEVPLAITALTSQDIEKRGITSVNDFVNNVPGINVSNVNSGRNDRSFQQISLRGMTPSTTTSTLTASFIDGVPVASATALNAVIDPARIELLKGPQNAYFGRNAFAGAINVVTRTPGEDFGGSITAMGGTRSNMDVSAALEGPIVADLLSFRITGRAFSRDGSYINGANLNQTLGDQETRTGTLQLELTPASGLKIRAMGMYSEDDDGPSAQGMLSALELRSVNGAVNIPFRSGNSDGTLVLPSLANCTLAGVPYICGAAPGLPAGFSPAQNTTEDALLGRILSNGALRFVSPKDGVQGYGLVRQYYHLHLNVDYELGDTGLTLSSLTGYNNESYSQLADLDNYDSSAFANTRATAANGLRTFWTFPFLVERQNKDFSQELRIAYDKGGALQAMLGASYLNTQSFNDLLSVFNEEQTPNAVRSAGTLSPPQQAKTIGIFGSVSYDITEALTVNFEGRWQQDEVFAFTGGRGLNVGPAAATRFGIPAGSFAPLTKFFSKKFDNFLPRIIVNYDVTPDMMIYASWSKAANVSIGSFNTNFLSGSAGELAAANDIGLGVIVEPETLDNYEVGFKGRFLDGRLLVSASAYLADWKNQHNNRSVVFLDTTLPNALPSIVSGVAATGNTRLKGFELDVTAEPLAGFTINASGSINDSDVQSFADPAITRRTGVTGDGFKGNQLPLTSKYSANIGAQYTGSLGEQKTWFMRADFSYKSRQFVDPANLTWINGRTQVNARIGVTLDQFSLEGFATNLFNNRQYTAIAQNNLLEPSFFASALPFAYLNLGLPELQTFGIRGSYRF